MKKILLTLLIALCLSAVSFSQTATNGDYRSIADGSWSTVAIWQTRVAGSWVAASSAPGASNNVYIQQGDNVDVTADAACANLHLEDGDVDISAGFVLQVNGKIRAYEGTDVSTVGADGVFYSSQVNNTSPNSDNVLGPGTLRFVGSTRNITETGEWGTNGLTDDAVIEFALTAGQTGTFNTGFKAETITITSGTINMGGNRLAPDGGAANQGTLTINGGNLISSQSGIGSGNQVASRTGTARFNTFTLASGGTLTLNGTTPCIDASTVTLSGTVVYGASAVQTFLQRSGQDGSAANTPTFTNVTLAGTSAKTLSQNTTINGTLSMQGSPTAASLSLGGFTLTYGGASTLEYAASVAQNTTSVEFPSSGGPFNLRMNNASGVTLHAARAIGGNLDMTSGVLTCTGGFILTVNDGGTTSNASNSSYVDGPMIKLGNDDFTFPVGDPLGSYHPLQLNNTSGAVGDSYTVEYFRASATALGSVSSPLYGVSNCEYWTVARNAGSSTPNLFVSWTAQSPCPTPSTPYTNSLTGLTVARLNAGTWVLADGTDQAASGTIGVGGAGSVADNGISLVGTFALGNTAPDLNPLPVRIGSIKAYEKANGVQIDWTVFTEINVDKYIIERSADGQRFTPIGDVAAYNSPNESRYGFFDPSPLRGVSFYRLRNLDIDGRSDYSKIVRVDLDGKSGVINVYPNPARSGAFISYNGNLAKGNYTARIFNASGQQVWVQKFTHGGGAINQTIQLPASVRSGMHSLQLDNEESKVAVKSFMVQ